MGFEAFIGNAQAVETVRRMLAQERVPGALLFTGPEGVGKKTLAVMLAKAVNCERRLPGESDFCGQCAACLRVEEMLAAAAADAERRREMKEAGRRVESLSYFDVQFIEPLTRYILTEQVRELRAVAYALPFELRRRVFIVDPASALHWQAVDFLLKVMEEPPATSLLILLSTHAPEVRVTLRSRAVQVALKPVEENILRQVAADEGRRAPAELRLALRVAAGSVGRLKTFDAAAYTAQRRPWLELLEALASEKTSGAQSVAWGKLFEATRALAENRAQLKATLGLGASLCHDLLSVLNGNPAQVVNVDLEGRLARWAEGLGYDGIRKLAYALEETHRLETRNVNPALGLEAVATEIVTRPRA